MADNEFPELEQYNEEYEKIPFVPFPSPDAAASMVIETAYNCRNDRLFIERTIRALQDWIEHDDDVLRRM